MPLPKDKKLKIIAAGLGAVLILVMYFQFFYDGGSAPAPPPGRGQAATRVTPTPFVRVIPRDARIEQVAITEPLPIELLNARHSAGSGTGRNIFVIQHQLRRRLRSQFQHRRLLHLRRLRLRVLILPV